MSYTTPIHPVPMPSHSLCKLLVFLILYFCCKSYSIIDSDSTLASHKQKERELAVQSIRINVILSFWSLHFLLEKKPALPMQLSKSQAMYIKCTSWFSLKHGTWWGKFRKPHTINCLAMPEGFYVPSCVWRDLEGTPVVQCDAHREGRGGEDPPGCIIWPLESGVGSETRRDPIRRTSRMAGVQMWGARRVSRDTFQCMDNLLHRWRTISLTPLVQSMMKATVCPSSHTENKNHNASTKITFWTLILSSFSLHF